MIEFAQYRLDLTDERLSRADLPIELRPKAFQVLRYLVERPGQLVVREELLEAVWPNLVVSLETLTQVIAELRRALGDDARSPTFIQTVHRRGFRFIADVRSSSGWMASPARPAPPLLASGHWLVGREAEFERLAEALLAAHSGRRQIFFVTGEPGIGKTSLIQAFIERQANEDEAETAWVAVGKCIEHHGAGEAYLPLLDALDRLAREIGPRPLGRCLSRYAPSWLAQLPWLETPDEKKQIPDTGLGSTPTRMLREFCLAMEALSRERTVVLVLEDLHWSDLATIDLIAALASRPDPARLLVLASYRPVEAAARSHPVAPLKRSLCEQQLCHELKLPTLDEAAVQTYLVRRLSTDSDPALAALIHDQTEGNPLFVVTLVHHLLMEGLLREAVGRKPSTPLEALREAVPESLEALVEAQLDRLDDEELEILQAGSVCGRSFDAQAIGAATGRDVVLVEKVCERLAGWGRLIESAGPSEWPDGSTSERYGFLHAVFRHIIYRRLPAGRRQQLHLRIAERLEAGFASQPAEVAAELALHFEHGGDPERAVEQLVAAAAGVRQRAGDREAVAYFEHALELLAGLPESDQRDRRELELRMHLWREINASGAVSAQDQDFSLERTLELCDRTRDAHSRAYASSYLTRSLIMACKLDEAESKERRVELASSLGDPILLAAAHNEIGDIAFYRGELDRGQRELALCLSALEGVDPPESCKALGHDPVTAALGRLGGWIHWLQGRPDEARRQAAACLARANACGHPLNLAFALGFALLVEEFRRDTNAAAALTKSFVQHAEDFGFTLPYPEAYVLVSWPLAQRGELDTAVAQLREGVAVSRRTGVREALSLLLAQLAETELLRGDAKAGLEAIVEARAFVKETGERFWEAEIHRIEGELRRLGGDEGRAEACFREALDVARAQGALSLELRAATSLAQLYKDRGRAPEARPLLAAVYGRFSEGFDTRDLQDAQTLLDSL